VGSDVDIDVGLQAFAALSDGQGIANPRFLRRGEPALTKAQRRLSNEEQGAPARLPPHGRGARA
jgi:putative transposase